MALKVQVGDRVKVVKAVDSIVHIGAQGVVDAVYEENDEHPWPVKINLEGLGYPLYLTQDEAVVMLEVMARPAVITPVVGAVEKPTASLLTEAEQAILLAARDDRPEAVQDYLSTLIEIYKYAEAYWTEEGETRLGVIYHQVHTEVEAAQRLLSKYIKDINQ